MLIVMKKPEKERGRTRFSNVEAAARSSQRQHQESDQTRDQDLNYLNRKQATRLTRRSGNFIRDDNAANMRQNLSNMYTSDARRNLRNFQGEDLVTPTTRQREKRNRHSVGRNARRHSSSRSRSSDRDRARMILRLMIFIGRLRKFRAG